MDKDASAPTLPPLFAKMLSQLFFIIAEAPPQPPAPGILESMLPFIVIMVIMYVLMIRPQQKKQRELAAKIGGLKTGDRVVTSGGLHGVVANIKDGPTLVLKVDDNVKLTVDKAAVAIVLPKE